MLKVQTSASLTRSHVVGGNTHTWEKNLKAAHVNDGTQSDWEKSLAAESHHRQLQSNTFQDGRPIALKGDVNWGVFQDKTSLENKVR